MALTWDRTEVKDYDKLTDEEWTLNESLIWATMAVGINVITVENARDFFARVSFWEKVIGAYRFNEAGPVYITPEDVLRFVGLKTNATPLTKAKFRNHVYETHERFNVPSGVL